MSYKFTNSLRSSELCECNMAAIKLIHFSKKSGRLSSTCSEFLTFGSHCSANFPPILDCFMAKFKLEYDDLENIKTDRVNAVVFNLHQVKRLNFFGTPCTKASAVKISESELEYFNFLFKFKARQKRIHAVYLVRHAIHITWQFICEIIFYVNAFRK